MKQKYRVYSVIFYLVHTFAAYAMDAKKVVFFPVELGDRHGNVHNVVLTDTTLRARKKYTLVSLNAHTGEVQKNQIPLFLTDIKNTTFISTTTELCTIHLNSALELLHTSEYATRTIHKGEFGQKTALSFLFPLAYNTKTNTIFVVILANAKQRLLRYNVTDGTQKVYFNADTEKASALCVDEGHVYLGTLDGLVRVFDAVHDMTLVKIYPAISRNVELDSAITSVAVCSGAQRVVLADPLGIRIMHQATGIVLKDIPCSAHAPFAVHQKTCSLYYVPCTDVKSEPLMMLDLNSVHKEPVNISGATLFHTKTKLFVNQETGDSILAQAHGAFVFSAPALEVQIKKGSRDEIDAIHGHSARITCGELQCTNSNGS